MTAQAIDFDKQALKKKYREERDKRLRTDGNEQYVEIKTHFPELLEDPYVAKQERAPKTDHVKFTLSVAALPGLWLARVSRKRALMMCVSLKRAATLAAPGIGTVTPAPNAIPLP